MPNPELSQYHDHDTNTVYDYKDATARGDINNLNTATQRNIIALYFPSTGTSSGYTQWGFTSASENYGYFDGHDMQMVRVVFYSNLADFTKPVQFIYYGDYERGAGVYICDVYSDWLMTDSIDGIYKNGQILDFIFSRYENSFVLVGCAGSVDLSNYYTKSETDNLLNDKADTSSLATVATSGDYDDLLNKPTIPSAQVNSDWNAVSGVAEILNKPSLATVATSGNYDDLMNKPTIPDISTKMDKSNPTGSGKLSINRKLNSAEGSGSSTIGYDGTASGLASVAGGYETIAAGDHSQANNFMTQANGNASTANGWETIADSDYQQVGGKFNVADNADTYAEIIGNGSDANNRSNARTLDWSGNETIAGDLYFNGNATALSSQLSDKADSSSLATVATSGDYDDLLNKPTIPAAQVQSDWTQADNTAADYIKNKPNLATVATSGNYSDLNGKPFLPTTLDSQTFSETAIKSQTKALKSKTLDKGIYICVGCAQFASNATGFRSVSFKVNGADSDNYAFVMPAVSGAKTYTQITLLLNLTQTTNTVIFQGYQNSGSDLLVTGMFESIRIA